MSNYSASYCIYSFIYIYILHRKRVNKRSGKKQSKVGRKNRRGEQIKRTVLPFALHIVEQFHYFHQKYTVP